MVSSSRQSVLTNAEDGLGPVRSTPTIRRLDGVIKMGLPLNITHEEIDEAIGGLDEVLGLVDAAVEL